jgi:mRNA interferase MazF
MTRGDLYLVQKPNSLDPKRQRPYVVVSRQWAIESSFPTVICAPILTKRLGLSTQVDVGPDEGLKHESAICCDELISLSKGVLTHYIGRLGLQKLRELNLALGAAIGLVS